MCVSGARTRLWTRASLQGFRGRPAYQLNVKRHVVVADHLGLYFPSTRISSVVDQKVELTGEQRSFSVHRKTYLVEMLGTLVVKLDNALLGSHVALNRDDFSSHTSFFGFLVDLLGSGFDDIFSTRVDDHLRVSSWQCKGGVG